MLFKEQLHFHVCVKFPCEHYVVWNVRPWKVELFFRIRPIVLSFYPFLNSKEKFTIFQKQFTSTVSRPNNRWDGLVEESSDVSLHKILLCLFVNLLFLSLVDIINLFFNLTNSRVMDMYWNYRKEKKLLAHRESKHLSWSFDKICGLISEAKRYNLYFFQFDLRVWKHKLKRVNTDGDRRRIFSCPCLNCLQL